MVSVPNGTWLQVKLAKNQVSVVVSQIFISAYFRNICGFGAKCDFWVQANCFKFSMNLVGSEIFIAARVWGS